jgi:P-type conjugative transfer protein TrbJ
MKGNFTTLGVAAAIAAFSISGIFSPAAQPAHASGLPVFDAGNYAENLLQAARALKQINNQVKSLQNETSMLQAMATNLKTIDFPQLEQLTSAMQQINDLMSRAQGIDFQVRGLDERIQSVFPGELQHALTSDRRVTQARAELNAATAAYRQSMMVQAEVAQEVGKDAGLLKELAGASQSAVGALQVAQASNQLLALSVKQQLQLQNLMASEFREEALERARRAQAEEDGRAATREFLDGSAPEQK